MKEDFWVAETREEETSVLRKRKKRFRKRIEFVSWGSRPLIEFLEALGEDTSTQRSQHEVVNVINKYIDEKGLVCLKKKRKVNCDDVLFAIFRRKAILRSKVHNLLEEHFAENRDSTSDDDSSDFSGEDGSKEKKKVVPKMMGKAPDKKPRSCFAAIAAENIKLVYLKKTLVEELLVKGCESFDSMLVGSFVRLKCDPNDISHLPFQLQIVTGMDRGNSNEILLKLSNYHKDVPINMLSDGNFEEGEVEDVRKRVKAGLLKRLLLVEVQAKAQMLHSDITKHSIAKELNVLKHRIEHANIKGWRKQLWELRERKKKLETPLEIEKLLNTMPEVIAEELVVDPAAVADSEGIHSWPQVSSDDSQAQEVEDAAAADIFPIENKHSFGDILISHRVSFDDSPYQIVEDATDITLPVENKRGSVCVLTSPRVSSDNSHGRKVEDAAAGTTLPVENNHCSGDILTSLQVNFDDSHAQQVEDATAVITPPVEKKHGSGDILASPQVILNDSPAQKMEVAAADSTVDNQHADAQIADHKEVNRGNAAPKEIDLSSDDDDKLPPPSSTYRSTSEWHYKDPKGEIRGPFSLNALKRWSDAKYFSPHFRIWRNAEASGDGVLLLDVLRRAFPS